MGCGKGGRHKPTNSLVYAQSNRGLVENKLDLVEMAYGRNRVLRNIEAAFRLLSTLSSVNLSGLIRAIVQIRLQSDQYWLSVFGLHQQLTSLTPVESTAGVVKRRK
jgi:hypothetical protein